MKPRRRRRTPIDLLAILAPDLLFVAVILLLMKGAVLGAALIVCTGLAAGFVGWHLGRTDW